MYTACVNILASFTAPYETGNSALSLLWILPLLAAVAIVWKTLKVQSTALGKLVREVMILFGTLLVCYGGIAVALYIVSRLIVGG
jgi:hypothetical protein